MFEFINATGHFQPIGDAHSLSDIIQPPDMLLGCAQRWKDIRERVQCAEGIEHEEVFFVTFASFTR